MTEPRAAKRPRVHVEPGGIQSASNVVDIVTVDRECEPSSVSVGPHLGVTGSGLEREEDKPFRPKRAGDLCENVVEEFGWRVDDRVPAHGSCERMVEEREVVETTLLESSEWVRGSRDSEQLP